MSGRWWAVKKVIHRGEPRWTIINKRTGGVVDRGGKRPGPMRFRSSADAVAYITRRWTRHLEKLCRGPFGDAYIDEKIVPLIKLTWKLGIKTEMCCQNQQPQRAGRQMTGRWVMVKLPSADAVRWFNIAKQGDWDCWDSDWTFGAHPSYPDGDDIPIFIYFRWRQLPGVMARLRAALRQATPRKGEEGLLPLAKILEV